MQIEASTEAVVALRKPFDAGDFAQTAKLHENTPVPETLRKKIDALRHDLDTFPEFKLDFFSKRIVRRNMVGKDGRVFGRPHASDGHWYLFIVNGENDGVQLNIGMWKDYMRVGMAFMFGQQKKVRPPAWGVFQSFLGVRPPLPFRDFLHDCIKRNDFEIERDPSLEIPHIRGADEVIHWLETYVVRERDEWNYDFVFLGALWDAKTAATKKIIDYHNVFTELMPFYEELLLAGGRYHFDPPEH